MSEPTKPTLAKILQGLKPKDRPKPVVNPMNLTWLNQHKPVPRPHPEWLMDAVPPKTKFEQDMDRALEQRAAKPHTSKMPDPRKPWSVKGGYVVERLSEVTDGLDSYDKAQAHRGKATPGQPKGVQETIHYNNAKAKAAQGKRLTRAEKKILAKHDLHLGRRIAGIDPDSEGMARIVAGLRPKQSD